MTAKSDMIEWKQNALRERLWKTGCSRESFRATGNTRSGCDTEYCRVYGKRQVNGQAAP